MKKTVIVAVVVALALGGWLVYDKTRSDYTSSGYISTSQSKNSTAEVLDYSNQGLTSVGPDIYNQATATSLLLSNNSLKSLPSQMGKMTNLQVLKLDHNRLQGSLIAEIRQMPLVTLDLSYNDMTGIPAEIGQLTHLQTLNYSYNNINTLPNEIANLKNNLTTLNLTGNPLSASQISQLKAELPNTIVIF